MPPGQQARDYWFDVSDVVADDSQQCEANVKRGKVLLMLNTLVDGDKDGEVAVYPA
jgi:hypothetical protein